VRTAFAAVCIAVRIGVLIDDRQRFPGQAGAVERSRGLRAKTQSDERTE